MRKIYLSIVFAMTILSTSSVIAQNKDTKKADQHYDRLEYIKAAEEYEKLVERDKADDYVYTQLGNSYYYINNTAKAEPYYKQVVSSSSVDSEIVYNYAQTLKANGKAAESRQWMERFSELSPSDSRARAFKSNPDYLPKLLEGDARFEVSLIEELSSSSTDFGGVIFGDRVYFTSSRGSGRKHGMNEEPFLDIYQATIMGDSYVDIGAVKGDVNTKYHEGIMTFTPDGNRMYFDRNNYYKGKFKKDEEGINQLNIYYAETDGDRWRSVEPVPFNHTEYSVGHPALSPNGNWLYFVSDMPGSIGGSDIYRVAVNSDGTFGEPENLGSNINTEGKEVFPYVGEDGTLYFSSDGHLGIGGLDVFYAEPQSGGGFGEVKNMGSPVNSISDDFAFSLDQTSGKGLVSSNRQGNVDNIFALKEIEICKSEIRGIIVDQQSGAPLSGARVQLYDSNDNRMSEKVSDGSGRVRFEVECDYTYVLRANKEEYESGASSVLTDAEEVTVEVPLRPIEEIIVEDRIVLDPILFDFDKHNIKPQAALELDKLVQVMKKYPKMVIRVEAHTDNRGSASYNKELSDRRAKSTVQYVISQGIDESRISGSGYGQENPVIDCGANCSEEDHEKNRRSEFIIVER